MREGRVWCGVAGGWWLGGERGWGEHGPSFKLVRLV